MSVVVTSHDPRGSVVRLPVGNVRDCLMCGGPPSWEIQSRDRRKDRSCRACLDPVLDLIFLDRWDGFAPITVAPLSAPGGTA